jgi:hypothetical protein
MTTLATLRDEYTTEEIESFACQHFNAIVVTVLDGGITINRGSQDVGEPGWSVLSEEQLDGLLVAMRTA